MTASDESDVEMSSALLKPMKKTKKMPPRMPWINTEDILRKKEVSKKVSTKIMIHSALTELKSRKGVSLYAIKKYMVDNYQADTERLNYYIKKYIKTGVEAGTIIQTKGIGASGSFRLAAVKEKAEKKKILAKPMKPKVKEQKISPKVKKIKNHVEIQKPEKKEVTKKKLVVKEKPKMAKSKETIEVRSTKPKDKLTSKAAKDANSSMKKRGKMMKRKSIGSIIKPPKMKPKSKA